MTYEQLLEGIAYSGGAPRGESGPVVQDSRKVTPGATFVCIKGRSADGHQLAREALDAGAGMVVSERLLGLANEVVVENTRAALAGMSQNYFGNPAKKLTLVGVTGTNGKTTTGYVIHQLLNLCGFKSGLVGSIQSEIGGMEIPARFTTPEAWDLAALQSRMVAAGCTHGVIEASSQALAQGRLLGQHFALGVFTNLSRDHLDYHDDMEDYFGAKRLLFQNSNAALVNLDDEWGRKLLEDPPGEKTFSYSTKSDAADFVARSIDLRAGSVRFGLLGEGWLHPVKFPMPGEYSVYNALAGAGAAILLGADSADVAGALGGVKPVKGRCEVLYNGPFTVIRDFAHTADGIDKLLGALRPFVEGKLRVVYGCAGQRDAVKRPPMSEAVVRWADDITLTDDNPRLEDPEKIFTDALAPLQAAKKPWRTEHDRKKAIGDALEAMQPGDTLVLCGKGHENYQVMDGYTLFLDEALVVDDWLLTHDHAVRPQPPT